MTDEGGRGAAEGSETAGDEPTESSGAPSSEKPGLVRLKWLKINKYRNVRPTTLRFDDGFNVVLGMNGSGKTTLLKLLAAVISSDFSQLSSSYDVEYELELLGVVLSARAWVDAPGRVLPGPDPQSGVLDARVSSARRRFEGSFRALSTGLTWTLSIERDAAILGDGSARMDLPAELAFGAQPALWPIVVASVASVGPEGVATLSSPTRAGLMAIAATVRRLDESLETLAALVSAADEPRDLLACPVVSAAGDNTRASAPEPHGLGAGGFWLRLPSTREAPDNRGFTASLDAAGPLGELGPATGLQVAMTLRFLRSQPVGDDFLHSYRGLSFSVRHASGEVTTHEPLSYGQKRLLTFLYYLAVNDYVVIADELVNGLHHSWIKLCLVQIGHRQAFLTSQNPLLLDYLPPASAAQAVEMYVECRAVPSASGQGEDLVWSNMSQEDAESVMSAYDVGIQRLSEVLSTKGLW